MKTLNTYLRKLNRLLNKSNPIFSAIIIVQFLLIIVFIFNSSSTIDLFREENYGLNSTVALSSEHLSFDLQDKVNESFFSNQEIIEISLPDRINEVELDFITTEGINNLYLTTDLQIEDRKLIYSKLIESNRDKLNQYENYIYWSDKYKLPIESLSDNESLNVLQIGTDYVPSTSFFNQNTTTDNSFSDIYLPIRNNFKFAVRHDSNSKLQIYLYKRDLNFYEKADNVSVVVKDAYNNIVSSSFIQDDGVDKQGDISSNLQKHSIEIDAPPGIYFVDVSQNDSIIERFSGNFSKFVVINSLFLANNTIYTPNVEQLDLYTDASTHAFSVVHNFSLQEVKVNNELYTIDETNVETNANQTDLIINKLSSEGNIVIKTNGNISTSKELLFNPYPINALTMDEYTGKENIDLFVAEYDQQGLLESGTRNSTYKIQPGSNSLYIFMEKNTRWDGIFITSLIAK